MTALEAGDRTPYKFFAYGDQGIDKFPQGQGTAQNVIKDTQEDEYRLVFHNGDISYALGYVRILSIARLSKAKSTTHDFAQTIMKKLLKQKINYPIS